MTNCESDGMTVASQMYEPPSVELFPRGSNCSRVWYVEGLVVTSRVSDTVMQVVLSVVSSLPDFDHVPVTFTAVFTAGSSIMLQDKLKYVPL